jgi:hypothetical protein
MSLFRRKQRHQADQPMEEDARLPETATPRFDLGALPPERPIDKTIDAEELRTAANPEDDGARTQMIENERRRDERGA